MTVVPSPSPHPEANDVAMLVGNGLSIAFNRDLTMPNLTGLIIEKFNATGQDGTDAAQVLLRLVHDLSEKDAVGDFEALLGPLDSLGTALRGFEALSPLANDASETVTQSIKVVAGFLEDVRRLGVSHVLELINNMAYADHENTVVRDFITAAVEATRGGHLTVANLNYDALVLSALLELDVDMCDMAMGYGGAAFDVSGEGMVRPIGYPMRSAAQMRDSFVTNKPVILLHLHGSLAWLKSPDGRIYKFPMSDLRMADYWRAWREGRTAWEPQVVLTNQRSKSDVVLRPPYSVAYDAFYAQLRDAPKWLIAGYSFRDECVNDLLARAWEARRHKPKVLVVTHGEDPAEEAVTDALRWEPWQDIPPTQLLFWRDGVESAPSSLPWAEWVGDDPLPF